MADIATPVAKAAVGRRLWRPAAVLALIGFAAWQPGPAIATIGFILSAMVSVAPIVIPGLIISAWVSASGAGARIARAFEGNRLQALVAASAVGAVTPVCGVTVLPLMAGLLSAGVPLAPVMAFWLSSPVTSPTIFAVTAAVLGLDFAIGKTLAAFAIGLMGGLVTASLAGTAWTRDPLRRGGIVKLLDTPSCGTVEEFRFAIWRDPLRRARFLGQMLAMTRLLLICLSLAFAAEYWMQQWLEPQALAAYVGGESRWAVPLSVFVGAPAYLDSFAALPLTRGLIDHGMSQAAAMAFLVSGGVVSIWGALAVFPVLRIRPFLLYLGLAVVGSLAAGWLYGLWA